MGRQRFVFAIFLLGTLVCPSPSHAKLKCPPLIADALSGRDRNSSELEDLHRFLAEPVFDEGGRAGFVSSRAQSRNRQILFQSPTGDYLVRLVDDPALVYPQTGLPDLYRV